MPSVTLYILTTVKYHEKLLQTVKIGYNVRKNVLLKNKCKLNNRKRHERREHDVCAMQQLLTGSKTIKLENTF